MISNYPRQNERVITQTNTGLEYYSADRVICNVNSNSAITISGLLPNRTVKAIVNNTHLTNSINITLPTAISDPSPAVVPALMSVEFEIFYNGTDYYIAYSGALS